MDKVEKGVDQFLKKHNFLNIEVPGDGNCFFHCIHTYFMIDEYKTKTENYIEELFTPVPPVPNVFEHKNKKMDSSLFRNEIFEYIIKNKEIKEYLCLYGGYEKTEDLIKEVEELNIDTNYEVPVFDFFPIVVASLYKLKVCVYPLDVDEDENFTFYERQIYTGITDNNPTTDTTDDCIHLLYINRLHYELLIN